MIDKNKIWFSKNDDSVIAQGKIVVTDQKKYCEIISELKDINTYVDCGSILRRGGLSRNYTEYISSGANIYENNVATSEHNFSHWLRRFKNPRAEVLTLISADLTSDINLLNLFATLDFGDSTEKRIERFNYAKKFIIQLENSCLDSVTLQQILKQMWPNFGFYATEVLKCTDVEFGHEYNIEDLQRIVVVAKKLGVNPSSEVENILSNVDLAKTNGKVLSLAKRVHKLV
jgi:hypothetical protein